MFYLVEFLKILKANKILGAVMAVSLFSVYSISLYHFEIKTELSLHGKVKNTPYFNALLKSNVDFSTVQRRMSNLPGVISVEQKSNKKLLGQLKELKGVFGDSVISNLTSGKYQKIKIELEKGIKDRSFTLIKEYLSRLVGKNSVTIGQMKEPRRIKLKKSDPLFIFLQWIDTYALILATVLWSISAALLSIPLLKRSYIIEKFQRKKLVHVKLLGSGFVFLLAITMIVGLGLKTSISQYGMAFSILFFMILIGVSTLVKKTKKLSHAF